MPPEESIVARISSVGLSSYGELRVVAQRGVEPAGLQAVSDEHLGESGIGHVRESKEACQQSERGDVQVRTLSTPLLEEGVDVVGRAFSHLQRILPAQLLAS
jgi:hypothetical protein